MSTTLQNNGLQLPTSIPGLMSPAPAVPLGMAAGTPGRSQHSGRSADRQHMCEWQGCGKMFGQHAHLVTHIKLVHEGSRDFVCSWQNCGRSFGLKSNLQTHIRTVHEGRKDYTCVWENCGRSFGDQGNLAKHIRTVHEGRKDYVCPMPDCGRSFSQKGHLGIHIRTVHEGRKDYVCEFDQCGRSFGYQSDLTSHIRTVHEGRKDFVCNWDECGRSFSQKGHLTTHIRTVHEGRKDYVCVVEGCGKSFGHHFQLTRHLRTMHEEHPSAKEDGDDEAEAAAEAQINSHFVNTKKRLQFVPGATASPNKKAKTESLVSLEVEGLPHSLQSINATRVKGGVRLVRGRSPKAQEILAANSHNSPRRAAPKKAIHRQADTLLANEELPPEDDDAKPGMLEPAANTVKNSIRTVLMNPGEAPPKGDDHGDDMFQSPPRTTRRIVRTPPSTKTVKGGKPAAGGSQSGAAGQARPKKAQKQDDQVANLLMGMKTSRIVTEPRMNEGDETESEDGHAAAGKGKTAAAAPQSPSRRSNRKDTASLKVRDSPAKSTTQSNANVAVMSPTRASRRAAEPISSPVSARGSRSSNRQPAAAPTTATGAQSRQSSEGLMLLIDATTQDTTKGGAAAAARSPAKQGFRSPVRGSPLRPSDLLGIIAPRTPERSSPRKK